MAKNRKKFRFTVRDKKVLWVVVTVVLIVGIVSWIVYNQITVRDDRARFANAAKTKSDIADRMVAYMGDNVLSTREQDECFNTEQGPYDNGRLWCQVATVIQLKDVVNYSVVAKQYVKFGQVAGWLAGYNDPFSGVWVMDKQSNIKCQLEYQDNTEKQYGLARRIPFNSSERPAVTIACADRAKAAHYTYVK